MPRKMLARIRPRTVATLCLMGVLSFFANLFGPVSFQFRHFNGVQALSIAGGVRTAQAGTSAQAFFKTKDGKLLAVFASNRDRMSEESLGRFELLKEYFGSGLVVRDSWPIITVKEALEPLGPEEWRRLSATQPLMECRVVVERHWTDLMDEDVLAQLVADGNLKTRSPEADEGDIREDPDGRVAVSPAPRDPESLVASSEVMTTVDCRSAFREYAQVTFGSGDQVNRDKRVGWLVEAAFRTPVVDPALAKR